jgi:hypothetical protein
MESELEMRAVSVWQRAREEETVEGWRFRLAVVGKKKNEKSWRGLTAWGR